jgi:S1-C subfamily serine protease
MIDSETYRAVRNGVCAIGYLTQPLEVYRRNLESAIFQVIGTGFLVEEPIVITNRHVIGGLFDTLVTKLIPKTQLFIQFVAPDEDATLRLVPRMIREVSYLDNPKLDIGFVKYKVVKEEHFESIKPLSIVGSWDLKVSERVGICGYPYGTYLQTSGLVFRWGPVIQQGHISAVSPFDTTDLPEEILLDVRTTGGMSGAPIFRPESGEVIGVHYEGIEATTAFGIPVTDKTVEAGLAEFDKNRTVWNPT